MQTEIGRRVFVNTRATKQPSYHTMGYSVITLIGGTKMKLFVIALILVASCVGVCYSDNIGTTITPVLTPDTWAPQTGATVHPVFMKITSAGGRITPNTGVQF